MIKGFCCGGKNELLCYIIHRFFVSRVSVFELSCASGWLRVVRTIGDDRHRNVFAPPSASRDNSMKC